MKTTKVGDIGEEMAAIELGRRGYEIIERNWKTRICEIDVIAKRNEVVYFVEVKYRSSKLQGDGFDYITPAKLHHMQRAAEIWVGETRWSGEYALLAVAVTDNELEMREII